MGRLCLEAGRKQEAIDYFNQIHKIMKASVKKTGNDPLTDGTLSE
jgi:hypothetical protein